MPAAIPTSIAVNTQPETVEQVRSELPAIPPPIPPLPPLEVVHSIDAEDEEHEVSDMDVLFRFDEGEEQDDGGGDEDGDAVPLWDGLDGNSAYSGSLRFASSPSTSGR